MSLSKGKRSKWSPFSPLRKKKRDQIFKVVFLFLQNYFLFFTSTGKNFGFHKKIHFDRPVTNQLN